MAVTVAAATNFAAGLQLKVNGERMRIQQGYVSGLVIPVLRGLDGTAVQAHAVTSNVVVGLDTDFAGPGPGATCAYPLTRTRQVATYNAAGAIALPVAGTDQLAIINGTSARAMTLANPTKDQDGDFLWIASNGKAAHTVTYTAGLGNASTGYTVATFTTGSQQVLSLMALNGVWCQAQSQFSGTLTAILIALA